MYKMEMPDNQFTQHLTFVDNFMAEHHCRIADYRSCDKEGEDAAADAKYTHLNNLYSNHVIEKSLMSFNKLNDIRSHLDTN